MTQEADEMFLLLNPQQNVDKGILSVRDSESNCGLSVLAAARTEVANKALVQGIRRSFE